MKNIILLILLGAFASCNNNENPADANGNFESNATTISAENAGKLSSFTIEEGDIVKSNSVVGIIDTTQLYLKKEQLRASSISIESQSKSVLSQIDVLKEQLKVQESNLSRIRKMYKDGSATKKQLDDLQGQVNVTKQQISSVQAQNASVISQYQSLNIQIKQIEDQISKSIIKNPVAGTILIKYVEQYEFVAPGKPLYQIQDINRLKLKAYVTEPQLSTIKIGQKVKIGIDSTDEEKSFDGTITWISSQAEFTPKIIQTKDERQNLVYAIKIDVNNDGSLKIGMPASVYFN
ncbi:MAG: HlyD family efflux transporter periplasmic adaptor subunit [Bacteroidota bacterium]